MSTTTSVRFDPGDISDWFWDIVHQAHGDAVKLQGILEELPSSDIRRFALEFMVASDRLRQELYTSHLDYRSEDNVADMSYWVVSQGKDFYVMAWMHPETIAAYNNAPQRPSLEFVAESILEDRLSEWPDITEDYRDYGKSGYSHIDDYWEARRVREQQPQGQRHNDA